MGEPGGFAILVSLVGGRPARFGFDQARVVVGRGLDADLRIEHAGVSRAQFAIERGVGAAGEARFRITPFSSKNPTLVNDRPAVEGALAPGDLIAVADVRVVLERAPRSKARPATGRVPPLRAVLLAAATAMALWVCWLWLYSGDDGDADLATAQTRLFLDGGEVARCANPIECDTRAHDAYARGKRLLGQAGADPGNLYRAALELDKAAQWKEQSGRPLADMADVSAQAQLARARAEAEFRDARFALSRAIATGDSERAAEQAALLARIVPDERHPYRVRLDAYRRGLKVEGK
jgi:hypothetical protein